jgi:hypothetical protein
VTQSEYIANRARRWRIATGRQAPIRLCRRCGQPAASSRHHYCDSCRAVTAKKHHRSSAELFNPLSTKERGYGADHRRRRAVWKPKVDRGDVSCPYCGRWIQPGTAWDLSHPFDDKTQSPVPWHMSCNRKYAASVTKNRRRNPT